MQAASGDTTDGAQLRANDGRHRLFLRALPVMLAAIAYLGLPQMRRDYRPPGRFVALAEAFLAGRMDLMCPAAAANELIPTNQPDRFFCPYPPMPAVLLMPFVWLLGASIRVATACRVISLVNVLILDMCLDGLCRRLGRPPLTPALRLAVTLAFALGMVPWHNADAGGDWHLAHASALCAMLLALREYVSRDRPLLVGLFVALAMLARPTASLTGVFFLLEYARRPGAAATIARFFAGPAIGIALLAAYNAARFGSPFDFGYDRMLLDAGGAQLLHDYGQFNVRFIPVNAFWFFVAPPWPPLRTGSGVLGFDPRGMSIWLTSPVLIYAIAALRQIPRNASIRNATIALLVCLIPLLMYFNTGYYQFGHRFAMDYLPMLMILLVAGMPRKNSTVFFVLAGASIAMHAWGILWASAARIPAAWTPTV